MIQDIVDEINESLDTCLQVDNAIFYGLTIVINVNGETYPVTIIDGKPVKICLNDQVDLQVYHRITGIDYNEMEEYSFGRNTAIETVVSAKMIVIVKNNLVAPELIGESMPHKTYLDGFKSPIYINKTSRTVIFDHDNIVNREWKKIDYSKHKCKFLVFEVNYTIRTVQACKVECGSFLLTEEGYKLLQEDGSLIVLQGGKQKTY